MRLIIMPSRAGQHDAISINLVWVIVAGCVLLLAAIAGGAALQRAVWLSRPESLPLAATKTEEPTVGAGSQQSAIDALAARVGTLQASVARLNGLGQRVAKVAGLPDSELDHTEETPEAIVVLDGILSTHPENSDQGGVEVPDLERTLEWVAKTLLKQDDYLSILDLALTKQAATQARLPTAMPIEDYPYLSSSYGWRRNPVNGTMNMHEGLDFSAPPGTPIRAATGGVVRTVTVHPGYGNMVDIDHGEGLITRYAHARVILVKEGQIVERGQVIARVGSTGLSTGPHLHFEVRRNDKALDPRAYLAGNLGSGKVAASGPGPVTVTAGGVTWRPRVR